MSIFSSILSKLGFGSHDTPAAPAGTTGAAAPAATPGAAPAAPRPVPISTVDVAAKLEQMASSSGERLNWRTSIVDLLKLLGLDSSFGARKELATELHCPAELMADSAQMNMWLHQAVLRKLADNGGNIPADLLH